MRDYGKVYTAFWTSEDVRGVSEDARMLALYLMTCQHGNMLGCFRLPNAYAAEDLQWGIERVSKGFQELFGNGFAYRCDRTFWVFIRHHLKWNKFENPNVGIAAGKLFDTLSCPHTVKALLVLALREFAPHFPAAKLDEFESNSEPFENPFETISKPVAVAVAVTTALAPAETATGSKPASGMVPFQPDRRKEKRTVSESKNAETWNAYCEAYRARYQVDPVRNATTNAQIARFVDRLGVEEAPHVARFYVAHNKSWYVQQAHATGPMLSDAEGLRTQWATGNRVTAARAQQMDRTQTNGDVFARLIAEAEERERHGEQGE
jgi:hypothetical protein